MSNINNFMNDLMNKLKNIYNYSQQSFLNNNQTITDVDTSIDSRKNIIDKMYQKQVGKDYSPGNDLANYTTSELDCKLECFANPNCKGFYRSGNDCWLKDNLNGIYNASGNFYILNQNARFDKNNADAVKKEKESIFEQNKIKKEIEIQSLNRQKIIDKENERRQQENNKKKQEKKIRQEEERAKTRRKTEKICLEPLCTPAACVGGGCIWGCSWSGCSSCKYRAPRVCTPKICTPKICMTTNTIDSICDKIEPNILGIRDTCKDKGKELLNQINNALNEAKKIASVAIKKVDDTIVNINKTIKTIENKTNEEINNAKDKIEKIKKDVIDKIEQIAKNASVISKVKEQVTDKIDNIIISMIDKIKKQVNEGIKDINKKYEFIGCYKDTDDRMMEKYYEIRNLENCNNYAKENNFKYFGMQYPQGNNDLSNGECWAGNSYDKHGPMQCSNNIHDNYYMGDTYQMAVYKTK